MKCDPALGEHLANGIPHMDEVTGAEVATLIEHWRGMPREEFDASVSALRDGPQLTSTHLAVL